MWKKALIWCCVLVFGVSCYPEPPNRCPNPQDISPCVCHFPSYYLNCIDIDDVEVLRRVALNLEGVQTQFSQLRLMNSSLQYLPKEILEKINVYELYIQNVTLIKVFEDPPTSADGFQVIRFDNVKLLRGVIWTVFKNMRNLKTITIDNIPVPVIDKDFSDNVPHGLRQLELSNSRTRKFEIGVFKDFKSLQKIEVYKGRLQELHRASFPVPFNVRAMYFTFNKLKTIPNDLFTNMPNLTSITLTGNQLATVPESAFGGRFDKLEQFRLEGNPLKCDCSLRWIVRTKPFWFDGTCASPKVMHGKELKNLNPSDFHC